MTPEQTARRDFLAARDLWRRSVQDENRAAEAFAMRKLNQALDDYLIYKATPRPSHL